MGGEMPSRAVGLHRDPSLRTGLKHRTRDAARTDEEGRHVPLDEQDTSRWDAELIAAGEGFFAVPMPSRGRGGSSWRRPSSRCTVRGRNAALVHNTSASVGRGRTDKGGGASFRQGDLAHHRPCRPFLPSGEGGRTTLSSVIAGVFLAGKEPAEGLDPGGHESTFGGGVIQGALGFAGGVVASA